MSGEESARVNYLSITVPDGHKDKVILFQNMLLSLSREHFQELEPAFRRVTEFSASAIGVERVSVWTYSPDRSRLSCLDLYIDSEKKHQIDGALDTSEFPSYFEAYSRQKVIVCDDVRNDQRAEELRRRYLSQRGIVSFIDALIVVRGKVYGVISFEHVGRARKWERYESEFCLGVADRAALMIESIEREKTEKALRESEERYRSLLDAITDGFVQVDADGVFTFVNSRFSDMLGYKSGELIGKKYSIIADKANVCVIDENFDKRRKGLNVPYEVVFINKNSGQGVICSIHPRSLYDENGVFQGSVSIVSDVTERRNVESRLREEQEAVQRYLDIVGSIVIVISGSVVTMVNNSGCRILGYTQDEILGMDWVETFIPEHQRSKVRSAYEFFLNGNFGVLEYFENSILCKDGTEKLISWHNTPLKDDAGAVTGILCSGEDITQKRAAQEALRASELKFRTLVEKVPAITYITAIDCAQTPLYVSPQIKDFISISAEEYLSDPDLWWNRVHPDDSPRVRSQMTVDLARNRFAVMEYRVLTGQGDVIWIKDEASIVSDEAGRILFMQGIRYDITDLKEMQASLAASRQNFNNIVETSKAGILIVDPGGKIRFMNPAAEFLLNKKISAGIGSGFEFPLEEGKYIEVNFVSGFGEPGVAEMWVTQTVWQSEKMYLVLMHDITERKHSEDRIRAAAKEWHTTFDCISDEIAIVDRNFMIMRVNKACADGRGMEPSGMVNMSCKGVLRDPGECSDCPHQKAVDSKHVVLSEYYRARDRRCWEVTCSPIFDNNGDVIATIHISKDITLRREMEKQSRLAQLGKLVADMAHEVNNPLMIISGRAQLSLLEDIKDPEVRNNLSIIISECQRAKNIIQRLLRFAKPGKNEFKQVDMNKQIDDVVNLLEHQYALEGVTIARKYETPFLSVAADAQQLQEVFMNLLSNAKDAMASGGQITVTAASTGDKAVITVSDNGCGMSPATIQHLFEPFFTTKDKGTGLGLSVCYGILKNHNGEMRFESEEGKGTSVIVSLPIASSAFVKK